MIPGMFSAVSGLRTNEVMLDVASNDLANVNTIGFKGSRTTFKDSLSELQRGGTSAAAGFGGANPAQVGLGVSLSSIDNQMSGGSIQSTGNALDVAVQGDGWFRMGPGNPTPGTPTAGPPAAAQLTYSRAGNFSRNDQGYLTSADGYYIVGRTAAGGGADCYIQIPSGASNVSIGLDGSVSFVPPAGYTQPASLPPIGADGRATAGFISLAEFPNEQGLQRATGNRWSTTAASGAELVGTPGQNGTYGSTTSGAIEMSNVDMASEFTFLITAQRGFQANSKVISTCDQMLQDLVNMKG